MAKEYTEAQKEMMRKLGLDESGFEPSDFTDKQRLDMQEDAILELAEIISEVMG